MRWGKGVNYGKNGKRDVRVIHQEGKHYMNCISRRFYKTLFLITLCSFIAGGMPGIAINRRKQNLKDDAILLLLVSLLILSGGCTYRLTPRISESTMTTPSARLPYKILLRMADDFTRFEYVASYESREMRYRFGETLKEKFPSYLGNIFSMVVVTETLMEQKEYDFLAIPQFTLTNSFVRPAVFGIEVGVKIDFNSRDKSRIITVVGKGYGRSNFYFGSALSHAGDQAINEALIELKNQILKKQELFRSDYKISQVPEANVSSPSSKANPPEISKTPTANDNVNPGGIAGQDEAWRQRLRQRGLLSE